MGTTSVSEAAGVQTKSENRCRLFADPWLWIHRKIGESMTRADSGESMSHFLSHSSNEEIPTSNSVLRKSVVISSIRLESQFRVTVKSRA
jgi:hypothetical protein